MQPEVEPQLVPELLVVDVQASLRFWCDLCGFVLRYHRLEEGFAYIARGSAHVMLEQIGIGRKWLTGPLNHPLGRGINLEVTVPDIAPILSALRCSGHDLFMEPETRWYRVGEQETGVEQFLVTDPDGYLLRFAVSLGWRSASRS